MAQLWWLLVVELVVCIVFCIMLYNTYGSWRNQEWYVPVLTILGWVLCCFIVFMIPNDISMYHHCPQECEVGFGSGKPAGHVSGEQCTLDRTVVSPTVLNYIFRSLYWGTFLLTWCVFPIMQVFSQTGEFSFGERMKSAIRQNVLYYVIGGCVMAVVTMFYLAKLHFTKEAITGLPNTAIAAGNAYGLLLIIGLLGHGLVSVPRRLWRQANLEITLKRYQFELVSYAYKLEDSKGALTKLLKKIRKAHEITPTTDPYRKYVDIIISECPTEYEEIVYGEGNVELTYRNLAALRQQLKSKKHLVSMYQELYDHCLYSALELEDVLSSKKSPHKKILWSFKETRTHCLAKPFDLIEYVWKCYLSPLCLRVLCLVCVCLSIAVVWSELIFSLFCKPDLSLFSLLLSYKDLPFFAIQILVFIPVLYIAVCAYSSLFKLRLFNYYRLVPHQTSSSVSLLFSAAYLCRLISPMAYNFLNMIHYSDTAFLHVMGNLDLVPLFGGLLPRFFPMLLLPFSLFTLFNVYSRILALLRMKQFQFDETFSDDQIDEGKEILAFERENRTTGIATSEPLGSARPNKYATIFEKRKQRNKHKARGDAEVVSSSSTPSNIDDSDDIMMDMENNEYEATNNNTWSNKFSTLFSSFSTPNVSQSGNGNSFADNDSTLAPSHTTANVSRAFPTFSKDDPWNASSQDDDLFKL